MGDYFYVGFISAFDTGPLNIVHFIVIVADYVVYGGTDTVMSLSRCMGMYDVWVCGTVTGCVGV